MLRLHTRERETRQSRRRLERVLEKPRLSHPGIAGEHAHTAQTLPNRIDELVDRRSLFGSVEQWPGTRAETLSGRHRGGVSHTLNRPPRPESRSAPHAAVRSDIATTKLGDSLLAEWQFNTRYWWVRNGRDHE
jgi:hypothetical protein